MITEADVILSLDWLDLAGTLKQAYGSKPVTAKIIQVSCDAHNHRGWSMDYQALPPVDVYLMCEPEAVVPMLLEAVKPRTASAPVTAAPKLPPLRTDVVTLRGVAEALNAATQGTEVCMAHLPLGWNGAYRHFRHPLDYLGPEGGAGVGSGPGLTVGAALALKGSGRLVVGVLGDGDFLMANTAVWTAAHYQIPCLMIVSNNRSFFNDELHQDRVAVERSRPPENRWIGMRIGDPDIDLAAMARAQGATGIGYASSTLACCRATTPKPESKTAARRGRRALPVAPDRRYFRAATGGKASPSSMMRWFSMPASPDIMSR